MELLFLLKEKGSENSILRRQAQDPIMQNPVANQEQLQLLLGTRTKLLTKPQVPKNTTLTIIKYNKSQLAQCNLLFISRFGSEVRLKI